MKKNITINLCGRLYQIDEDAYELLSQYIETLHHYFQKQEDGEEIADDIEERVAELFDELKAQGIMAITIEHVQGVIHQIGQVEEIASETNASDTTTQEASHNGTSTHTGTSSSTQKGDKASAVGGKKFFRDSQNKMLAGVLAGCAQYYGGNANTWRWGYVIVCVVWFFILGAGPFSLTIPFEGFFGLFLAFPFALVSLPFAILPLLPYFLTAIFTPETKTPEDVLQMKGKEVNPMNLAAEVQEASQAKEQKSNTTFWNIFVGIIAIGASTLLAIGFIVALCFLAAFVGAPELMADAWWNVDEQEVLNAIGMPVILAGFMLLTSIGILLYCAIHASVSSFGKAPSMSTKLRVIWFLLWVASIAAFVGCTVFAANRYNKTSMAISQSRWEAEQQRQDETAVACDTTELDTLSPDIEIDPIPSR